METSSLFWVKHPNQKGVFSRTDAIRRWQAQKGSNVCFGQRFRRDGGLRGNPAVCGNHACEVRMACEGLAAKSPYDNRRLREKSIEILSEVLYSARAFQWPWKSMFQQNIEELIGQWANDTPQVALIGAFSSGKSTLLNRFFPTAGLPTALKPTTAVITQLVYGLNKRAIFIFRPQFEISWLASGGLRLEETVIDAMLKWVENPSEYGLQRIEEILAGGVETLDMGRLLSDLREITSEIGSSRSARSENNRSTLSRNLKKQSHNLIEHNRRFRVFFGEREPLVLDRGVPADEVMFVKYMCEGDRTMLLRKAICELPDEKLKHLNFMDTAGLCSPFGWHTNITIEVMDRRPDKILVMMDSKSLDGVTNLEALTALGRFIASPDDYRKVVFGLTFWDYALKRYMENDRAELLDYEDPAHRDIASKERSAELRHSLPRLLEEAVGIPCPIEPSIHMLAPVDGVPPDVGMGENRLWDEILRGCKGNLGIEMWASRWQMAKDMGKDLTEALVKRLSELTAEIQLAQESPERIDNDIRIVEERKQLLIHESNRMKNAVRKECSRQCDLIFGHIRTMVSKSQLIDYVNYGFNKMFVHMVEEIEKSVEEQNKRMAEIAYPNEENAYHKFPSLRIERHLLGLDEDASERIKSEMSGVVYLLKSVWDFLFASVLELSDTNRSRAREVLLDEAQSLVATIEWLINKRNKALNRTVDSLTEKANQQIQDKKSHKTLDRDKIKKLERKRQSLEKAIKPCNRVRTRLERYYLQIAVANDRIKLLNQIDSHVFLIDDKDRWYEMKKGREVDSVILSDPPISGWKGICLKSDKQEKCFYTHSIPNNEYLVVFRDAYPDSIFVPPSDVIRVVIRLGNLDGKIFSSKKLKK